MKNDLVKLMFGRQITRTRTAHAGTRDVCLSVQKLNIEDFRIAIENVNFDLYAGEVIGLGWNGRFRAAPVFASPGWHETTPAAGTFSSVKRICLEKIVTTIKNGEYFMYPLPEWKKVWYRV